MENGHQRNAFGGEKRERNYLTTVSCMLYTVIFTVKGVTFKIPGQNFKMNFHKHFYWKQVNKCLNYSFLSVLELNLLEKPEKNYVQLWKIKKNE